MLDFFFDLEVRTLLMVLFAGNFVSVGLICAFYYATDTGRDWSSSWRLFLAKSFQCVGFLLLAARGAVPDILSVNLGNTLAFIGFYNEAVAMLRILNEAGRVRALLVPILAVCVLGFNFLEFVYPDSSLRVASASICIILIYALPCLRLFISPNSGRFKQWVGVMSLCVLVMLFPRAIYALTTETSLLSNTYIQTMTFLAMALQLVFSLPAYLLLIKEDTDQLIASMATTDMLTGLSNRYSFLDAAQRMFLRSRINGQSIAVLFIDIDYFKTINDAHGHAFGDQVLVSLGRTIRECLRPTDLSCRYGGDEFVVLLHDADASSATLAAERIRSLVAMLSFPDSADFHFTLSVGVADGVPSEDDSLDLFIGRADSALYVAKRSGRDRISQYDPVSAFLSDI
jgi:diguanylate cyclase (GGDEF)-like protein